MRNIKIHKTNKSGIPGVVFSASRGVWKAQASCKGTHIHLYSGHDFDEAVAHRLTEEQLQGWPGCYSHSPAFIYLSGRIGIGATNEGKNFRGNAVWFEIGRKSRLHAVVYGKAICRVAGELSGPFNPNLKGQELCKTCYLVLGVKK